MRLSAVASPSPALPTSVRFREVIGTFSTQPRFSILGEEALGDAEIEVLRQCLSLHPTESGKELLIELVADVASLLRLRAVRNDQRAVLGEHDGQSQVVHHPL